MLYYDVMSEDFGTKKIKF